MSEWKAKRFWKAADAVEVEGGFSVLLDGRGVKTPAKQAMRVPTYAMAAAIAAEWDAQIDIINPNTMPVTKTANAAIDKVAVQHAEVAEMLAAYGDSDLLCYRADAPEELIERQNAQWNPMLEWAADALGARLETRTGVIHASQDPVVVAALRTRTHALDAYELAAFHDLVSLSGSLVLGFAATLNARPADELWTISRLDELWQEEQWGEDEDATALAAIKREAFLHAKRMFDLAQII